MSTNLEMLLIPVCGGLIILFIFFLGVIGMIWSLRNRRKADQSKGWPSANGVITNAYINENRSTDEDGYTTTTYTPKVEYQFNVGGSYYFPPALPALRWEYIFGIIFKILISSSENEGSGRCRSFFIIF